MEKSPCFLPPRAQRGRYGTFLSQRHDPMKLCGIKGRGDLCLASEWRRSMLCLGSGGGGWLGRFLLSSVMCRWGNISRLSEGEWERGEGERKVGAGGRLLRNKEEQLQQKPVTMRDRTQWHLKRRQVGWMISRTQCPLASWHYANSMELNPTLEKS